MSEFASSIDLSGLNWKIAVRIDGENPGDYSGHAVSGAGDVNGDGLADIIIGAFGYNGYTGASYVVFGKARLSGVINLSELDGSNGFRIVGEAAQEYSGFSVSTAGDVNGDGLDDLIVGAYQAGYGAYPGAAYVLFGQTSGFAASIDLTSLDGNNGFRLLGVTDQDYTGFSVSTAGDINGDGFDDLVIGAELASPNGGLSGTSYVVFGQNSGFSSNIDLSSLDGTNGFRLDGTGVLDRSGYSVASAGDLNGDGYDDVLIGTPDASPNGQFSGTTFVVFGKASGFDSAIQLSALDGTNGFRFDGIANVDLQGRSVASAGDVNGDGIDDIIVSSMGADPHGGYSGASYVIFGTTQGFASAINLSTLNGSNGFRIDGVTNYDYSGYSVAAAGDVNGDGFDDVIIGSPRTFANGRNYAGATYVVFGSKDVFPIAFALSDLNGANGFRIAGTAAVLRSGVSVDGAGDVNGDGFDDIIIGADGSVKNGIDSGSTYLIYGRAPDASVARVGSLASQDIRGGDFNDSLRGMEGDDRLFGAGGNDGLTGDAGADTLNGGSGRDTANYQSGPGVTVFLAHSALNAGGAAGDVLISIENVTGSATGDLILGNAGANSLRGLGGDDRMQGGDGLDSLFGGDGQDRLLGGAGDDKLVGEAGDDRLTGGEGRDVMRGGAGSDDFIFVDLLDLGNGPATRDTIRDFEVGIDKIDLHLAGSFNFVGPSFTGSVGEIRSEILVNGTHVFGDIDGNQVADFEILLLGSKALTAADFIL